MLLRCGAFIVAQTRFPRSAAKRFLEEPDSATWVGRLHIYGVDFSDFPALQGFLHQVADNYKVDVLINNAAQTIRRPPAYYRELFQAEQSLLCDPKVCALVRQLGTDPWHVQPPPGLWAKVHPLTFRSADGAPEELRSAALAMVLRLPEDHALCNSSDAVVEAMFPAGRHDMHGEQLDLRPYTSWVSGLSGQGAVAPRELLEVLAVNAVAPFLLLQHLLPVMSRAGSSSGRYVVNVTSAEGIFNADGASAKGSEHPHSNMAKAALNMLTKTAATELSSRGVYCVAVDPGWVSMMRPGEPNNPSRPLPPLSEQDGAARVIAPVLDGVRAVRSGRTPLHGVLLKNYAPIPW